MTELLVSMTESDSQRLEQVAERAGKSVQILIHDWITRLLESETSFDVTQDPVFQMEGYDSKAPEDLSAKLDHYVYGKGSML
ncbi:MAG: hypothetical protein AAB354_08205 [candidate division KSB1 bacterium]